MARDMDAKLLIVHVQEPPAAYGGGELYYGIPNPPTEEINRMLRDVVPTDPAVGYEHHLVMGPPADAIVDLAKEQGADLIVLGTHGRTGLMRLLMGSVAEAVVRRSPCPVLTYRSGADKVAPVT